MIQIELLEGRQLLAAVDPTPFEQYFVELMNRARANPPAEAKRHGIALNEGPPSTPLSKNPSQPLAINRNLVATARKYSNDLMDPKNPVDGQLNHLLFGTDPGSRSTAQGYPSVNVAENLVFVTHSGSSASVASVDRSHELLFVDFTATFEVEGRGHRVNILSPARKEIGVGLALGKFGGRDALVGTQDIGLNSAAGSFLTGVVYTDAVVDNDFYTPGEGLGGVTITAKRKGDGATFTTKTWGAGGYTLPLAPGTYDVSASGGNFGNSRTYFNVVIADQNVKRDFIRPRAGAKDSAAPTASLLASNVITPGGANHTFQVTYDDLNGINRSTIGTGDVLVTGGGQTFTATLVSKRPKGNGISIVATYRIDAPGGVWDAADNRAYTVKTVANQVKDVSGKNVAARTLGRFTVAV